jgi:glycosyltransferase involved in cell wall biosynthesis
MNASKSSLIEPILSKEKSTQPELRKRPSGNTVIVMPAFNAAKTLEYTFQAIPFDYIDEVILVDDGSMDKTVEIAKKLGISTIRHPHNAGYGANQKSCYTFALSREAEIVVMLHPDGQYDPKIIPEMIKLIVEDRADVVIGSRFLVPGGPKKGGMPFYKYLSNRFLTTIENMVLGQSLSEYHTGYRAYHKKVLETIPYIRNSNDFIFDQEFLYQAVAFGFRIEEIPVETKYFADASSINFFRSVHYGISTLILSLIYIRHRIGWHSNLFVR